jgi:hypothetical protein
MSLSFGWIVPTARTIRRRSRALTASVRTPISCCFSGAMLTVPGGAAAGAASPS